MIYPSLLHYAGVLFPYSEDPHPTIEVRFLLTVSLNGLRLCELPIIFYGIPLVY